MADDNDDVMSRQLKMNRLV